MKPVAAKTVAVVALALVLSACGQSNKSADPAASPSKSVKSPSASTSASASPSDAASELPEGTPTETPVAADDPLKVREVNGRSFVPGPGVAASVDTELTKIVGRSPDSVTCPDDGLEAKVGATLTCSLVDGVDEYDVAIVATAVNGDTVDFSIKVADAPN